MIERKIERWKISIYEEVKTVLTNADGAYR